VDILRQLDPDRIFLGPHPLERPPDRPQEAPGA
jgi:hypothetical protein